MHHSMSFRENHHSKDYSHAGVNFINVLRAPFIRTDPKSTNKTDSLTVFLVLLGSVRVKASPKTLMESNAGRRRSEQIESGYHRTGIPESGEKIILKY